jgi:hypothetical protein
MGLLLIIIFIIGRCLFFVSVLALNHLRFVLVSSGADAGNGFLEAAVGFRSHSLFEGGELAQVRLLVVLHVELHVVVPALLEEGKLLALHLLVSRVAVGGVRHLVRRNFLVVLE